MMIKTRRMWKISGTSLLVLSLYVIASVNCSHRLVHFRDQEPIWFFNDISPIPVPDEVMTDRITYYATVQDPPPAVQPFYVTDNLHARDVNCLDHVPASSWFIPRMGYQDLTPDHLLFGPTELGPPDPPLQILRVRDTKNQPRLFVRDSRGLIYLLKFDPPQFPALVTTTSLIVNRLFWGFGYHVPEDHLYFFERDDLRLSASSMLDDAGLDSLFARVAAPTDNRYRSIASRIIPGLPLGPTPERGIRAQDPNDYFAHQHRRILRALRVFAAFVNMPDIGSHNTLDMYVGEPGKGYIKHYLIDFDDAFGTHAELYQRRWAGYNHIFSIPDIFNNFITLGLRVQPWEYIRKTPWTSVGSFESTHFDPARWKETHPYEPIQTSQPGDQYWAAKIIAHFNHDHLEKLIEAARYPSKKAENYVLETCMERRDKILQVFFNRVSPIEFAESKFDTLIFKDMRKEFLPSSKHILTDYSIEILNKKGEKIALQEYSSFYGPIKIPHKDVKEDYIVLKIRARDESMETDSPASFHFVSNEKHDYSLVGVIH